MRFLIIALLFSLTAKAQFPLPLRTPAPAAAYDVDAQAFFTALEADAAPVTLSSAQKGYVNTLVLAIKSASLWTNMKAAYPMIGGTAASHKYNLKDPRDLDAAFRLVFAASPTHSSNGVDWNGTTQYADTKLIPNTHFTNTNATIGYYSRENVSESTIDMGVYDGTHATRIISLYASNSTTYGEINTQGIGTASVVTDTRGLFTATRTSASVNPVYRNATQVSSPSILTGAKVVTYSIYIGAANYSGTTTLPSTKQCAFAFIYDGGLNSTQVTNLYNAIQAFQTSLGRQV